MRQQINGVLLLDKPAGLTSNAALQRVKRLLNAKKAGHTGSLDPIATGMLPICFGEATKFSQYLLEADKKYLVVAKLGVQTTTGDSEGEVIATQTVSGITPEKVAAALDSFYGEIEQIPPMYSALKHKGQPLYKLARSGVEVERQPRKVTIYSLQLVELVRDEMTLEVHCSKGTYIRTLIEDISRQLGYGAHVIQLRRHAVSPYTKRTMYTLPMLEALEQESGARAVQSCLLSVDSALASFPVVTLTSSAVFYIRMGQTVRLPLTVDSGLVRLITENGSFVGIGEITPDGRIKPHRMLATS